MKKIILSVILTVLCLPCLSIHADWLEKISEDVLVKNSWDAHAIERILSDEIEGDKKHIRDLEDDIAKKQDLYGVLSKTALKTELIAGKAKLNVHQRVLNKLKKIANYRKKQDEIIEVIKDIEQARSEIKKLEQGSGVMNKLTLGSKRAVFYVKRRYLKTLLEV